MKIKKINEDFENDLESTFYFLNYIKNSKENIDFLKSLNLTKEQYIKLSEIFEDYGDEKYQDGCTNEYEE